LRVADDGRERPRRDGAVPVAGDARVVDELEGSHPDRRPRDAEERSGGDDGERRCCHEPSLRVTHGESR
jgi:hypothetical protein